MVADVLFQLGYIAYEQENYDQAINTWEIVSGVKIDLLGSEHQNLIQIYNYLGICL